jgi:hypothetical protein
MTSINSKKIREKTEWRADQNKGIKFNKSPHQLIAVGQKKGFSVCKEIKAVAIFRDETRRWNQYQEYRLKI